VIQELEFIAKGHCARSLERYWEERDITTLAEILNYARFPEQWTDEGS
jgi:hypothetical protein